ncbi:4Fe-4S dicluster domain-containing protein [Halobacteriovorax sp. GB3]|uniref:indolepyruvate ferredoxin oxidoreductase subunit alpha n=1 Tax=Halobacteriovorax sp. GB3 TaxID=2719615 RepID=UPI00235E126C|nr:4Fe-4S dicluster domain-containing protein [Halobacteriovorax sp. GB3]MDD0854799.1 4Fe-4S dicluster domain-containing protein [Halobacteriovorax sp. GB3]
MSEERKVLVENPYHTARLKPVRKGKKPPKLLAVVHQSGCTGCEVCIQGCPVDSIELVPGPDANNPAFRQTVEIDLARCIGCQNCSQDCPWETITMYEHNDAFIAWGNETLKTELYVSEEALEEVNESYGISLEPEQTEEGQAESKTAEA